MKVNELFESIIKRAWLGVISDYLADYDLVFVFDDVKEAKRQLKKLQKLVRAYRDARQLHDDGKDPGVIFRETHDGIGIIIIGTVWDAPVAIPVFAFSEKMAREMIAKLPPKYVGSFGLAPSEDGVQAIEVNLKEPPTNEAELAALLGR